MSDMTEDPFLHEDPKPLVERLEACLPLIDDGPDETTWCSVLGADLREAVTVVAELAAAPHQWLAICNAIIAAMPPGTWEAHHAAEHPCGNPLPVAVAAMTRRMTELDGLLSAAIDSNVNKIMAMSDYQVSALTRLDGSNPDDAARLGKQACQLAILQHRITGLEADLREERERVAHMRVEWGAEVAALGQSPNKDTARLEWMFLNSDKTSAEDLTFESPDAWRAWVDDLMQQPKEPT